MFASWSVIGRYLSNWDVIFIRQQVIKWTTPEIVNNGCILLLNSYSTNTINPNPSSGGLIEHIIQQDFDLTSMLNLNGLSTYEWSDLKVFLNMSHCLANWASWVTCKNLSCELSLVAVNFTSSRLVDNAQLFQKKKRGGDFKLFISIPVEV